MTEPIWLEVSVMLFAAMLGYLISRKMKQPVSIGIIIAGIIIGPSLLHIVSFTETISIIAQMGAIVLLFLVGLESDFSQIYTKKTLYIALGGVILPFVGGFFLSAALGFSVVVSLFIAAALTATSIGITAAVLREMGKLNTQTAKAILGAAVIDDILGLIILSIVIAVPTGIEITSVAFTILKAIGFVVVAALIGKHYVPKIVNRIDRKLGLGPEKEMFILAMGFAFGYSFVAEAIGLSAIVGAFMAGISLSRAEAVQFFYKGTEYLEAVFASIFFVALGVIVDLSSLFTNFYLIIALTVIAILTKLIGSSLPAKLAGFSKKDSLIIGVGMIPRGEVAVIIGLYGLTASIIDNSLYSAIVFMSFFTTIITPVLLKMVYKK